MLVTYWSTTRENLAYICTYIRMSSVKALKRSGVAFAAVTATGAFISVINRDIILRHLHDITCGLAQKLAMTARQSDRVTCQ